MTGSTVAIHIRPKHPVRVASLLILGFPLPLFLFAARSPAIAIAVLAFLAGVCIDLHDVLFDTVLQKHVPPEALARVISYEAVGSMAFVPAGAAIAGPVSAAVGIGPCLTAAGVLILLAAPAALLVRPVRQISDCKAATAAASPAVGPDPAASTGSATSTEANDPTQR